MKTTVHGVFSIDVSGSGHFHSDENEARGCISLATEEAIKLRSKPSWFWHEGLPVPMEATDTPETLMDRWLYWNKIGIWKSAPEMLAHLRACSEM